MGKSIRAFIITVISGFTFSVIGETINFTDLGAIMPVAIMGSFFIYFNENKNI